MANPPTLADVIRSNKRSEMLNLRIFEEIERISVSLETVADDVKKDRLKLEVIGLLIPLIIAYLKQVWVEPEEQNLIRAILTMDHTDTKRAYVIVALSGEDVSSRSLPHELAYIRREHHEEATVAAIVVTSIPLNLRFLTQETQNAIYFGGVRVSIRMKHLSNIRRFMERMELTVFKADRLSDLYKDFCMILPMFGYAAINVLVAWYLKVGTVLALEYIVLNTTSIAHNMEPIKECPSPLHLAVAKVITLVNSTLGDLKISLEDKRKATDSPDSLTNDIRRIEIAAKSMEPHRVTLAM